MRSGARVLATATMVVVLCGSGLAAGSECKGPLEPTIPGQCQGVTFAGCCDVLGRVWWCEAAGLFCNDCYAEFPSCGWTYKGYYDCGSEAGLGDPTGVHPYSCDECGPGCPEGSSCSAECSGACGACAGEGEICLGDGTCYHPGCDGRECGVDAQGYSCGSCGFGTECVEALGACLALPEACVPTTEPGCPGCDCEECVCSVRPECCTHHWDILCASMCETECGYDCSPCPASPSCDGLECGIYCGVTCGTCAGAGEVCFQFHCCSPSCEGAVCGSDGCGGECGACGEYDSCVGGACVPCQPQCEGVECGSDGCGGECGVCTEGNVCVNGSCMGATCEGSCGSQSVFGCFCDSQCLDYGDCCPDICSACPDMCVKPDLCHGIPEKGCCLGGDLLRCDEWDTWVESCESAPSCGWEGVEKKYGCGTEGLPEPSGALPMGCEVWCSQWCEGRSCGVSGCGTSCGECGAGQVCLAEGVCCTPQCPGLDCGEDGCGGVCGECPLGWACEAGTCTESCGGLSYQGCCDGNKLRYCDGGQQQEQECDSLGSCGWDAGAGYYNCGTTGEADPTGEYPRACPGGCVGDCTGRECGNDGCSGSCGLCDEGEACSEGGRCVAGSIDPEPDVVTPPDVATADTLEVTVPDLGTEMMDSMASDSDTPSPVGDVGTDVVVDVPKGSSGGCSAHGQGHSGVLAGLLLALTGLLIRLAGGRRRGLLACSAFCVAALAGCNSGGPSPVADAGDVQEVRSDLVSDGPNDHSAGDLRIPDAIEELADVTQPTDWVVGPDLDVADGKDGDTGADLQVDTETQGDVDWVEPPEYDCDNLFQGPFVLELIPGVVASEDLAFDGEGALVGSDDTAIYKSTSDAHVKIFVPNLEFRAGMRFLPSGSLVVADNTLGRLVLVSPEGVMTTLVSGLAYPNGLAVDLNGYIYVSEHDAGRVLRVHPGTGEYTVVANQVTNPNGLCFSPDYKTLYIGSFGSGWVYALSIDEDGTPGRLVEWGDMTSTPGMLDGLGVDACGNVYVCEYGETKVYRIPPWGGKGTLLVSGVDTYLPNMQWGRGPGWDPQSLYLPDGWSKEGVWRLKIGVPSAPLAYP